MSTRATVASALASISVLAIGWQVGTANSHTVAATTASTTTETNASGSSSASSGTSRSSTATSTAGSSSGASSRTSTASRSNTSGLTDGTYAGDTSSNRFGSVTVAITVSGGKLTAVNATAVGNDSRSSQINSRAIPVLKSETLAAQSGTISTVSGATYTSSSYRRSLQSALDQAAA